MQFSDFYSMTSRRDSTGCINDADHTIKKGETIGWSRRHKRACCAHCWRTWTAENDEARLIEEGLGCPW